MERKISHPKSVIKGSLGAAAKLRPAPQIALGRVRVSRNLNRRLPYYLTPEEAHRIISAAENTRDHLFLRWETGPVSPRPSLCDWGNVVTAYVVLRNTKQLS